MSNLEILLYNFKDRQLPMSDLLNKPIHYNNNFLVCADFILANFDVV